MSDILIIHHSLDASSARLLAKALVRLGFGAPVLCDERADSRFPAALAAGRVAIAIWSGAASGSAGFTGLATIAETAGKLLSLRGPEGLPPSRFGRAFMLAGWDGSDVRHPGLVELARALADRFKARRGREVPRIQPATAFGGEPPLHPGPASARLHPRRAPPIHTLRSAAQQALLSEDGDLAVLAPPRPPLRRQPEFEIDPERVIRRPTMPSPVRRGGVRRKVRTSVLSIVVGCAAFGALCGAVGALFVGEMPSESTVRSPLATVETYVPAPLNEAPPFIAAIARPTPAPAPVAEPTPEPAPAPALLFPVDIVQAPPSLESLSPVDLTLNVSEPARVEAVSWRVVPLQYVE